MNSPIGTTIIIAVGILILFLPRALDTIQNMMAVDTSHTESVIEQREAVVLPTEENQDYAILAGGCFWCVESDFDKLDGVLSTVSGYTGDVDKLNPTYRNHADHIEAVKITYDSTKLTYGDIINNYFKTVDYTDNGGQFCDRGNAYRPVIFTKNAMEIEIAKKLAPSRSVVPIINASKFWNAEEYHQDYYIKNPIRYKYYRSSCGRDATIAKLASNRS